MLPLLVAQAPIDAPRLATVLQSPMAQRDIANEWTDAFFGGPVRLADGVIVQEAFLRLRKRDPEAHWGLVLRIAGPCVQRTDVLRRHEGMEITGHPRGGSLDEETSWSRREPWGKLAFGFAERDWNCLSSILIAGPAW
ncbi:hypothetical protein ACQ859_17470 [Roseateles chitinivorans]|uniref:hypothetical protein n=1 Tax=Roseateles chitinivorans TaxID=2917965 RepID=UPI003D67D545